MNIHAKVSDEATIISYFHKPSMKISKIVLINLLFIRVQNLDEPAHC